MTRLSVAALFYGLAYLSDIVTSAYFILSGFGFAEVNQFQRVLFESPSGNAFSLWVLNQYVWISLGFVGLFFLCVKRFATEAHKSFVASTLVLFASFRLYGAVSNIGFTLRALYGIDLPMLAYHLVPLVVALLPIAYLLRDALSASSWSNAKSSTCAE